MVGKGWGECGAWLGKVGTSAGHGWERLGRVWSIVGKGWGEFGAWLGKVRVSEGHGWERLG